MRKLIIHEGARKTGEKELRPGATLIGRSTACDIVITRRRVSREHARLVVEEDKAVITDLGSTRGTLVNGQKITQHGLQHEDKIEIGGIILIYRAGEAPSRPAFPGGRERRKEPRAKYSIPVRYVIYMPGEGGSSFEGKATDISMGGICFGHPAALPVGTSLEMRIDLGEGGEAIEVLGKVAWTSARKGKGDSQVGVIFTGIEIDDQQEITRFVKERDGTVPGTLVLDRDMQDFLSEHIDSMLDLDVLLHFHGKFAPMESLDEVATSLDRDQQEVAKVLRRLERSGLIRDMRTGAARVYTYSAGPAIHDILDRVDRLRQGQAGRAALLKMVEGEKT